MNTQTLPPEEALASLNSRPQGLDAAEAKRRLTEFGPNQVQRARKKRLVRKLLE